MGNRLEQILQQGRYKQIKRCLTPLVIRGMHMKTTVRSHCLPFRMAKTVKLKAPSTGASMDQGKSFFRQLNICPPDDPFVPFLRIYPQEMKMYLYKVLLINVTVALLLIAPN